MPRIPVKRLIELAAQLPKFAPFDLKETQIRESKAWTEVRQIIERMQSAPRT